MHLHTFFYSNHKLSNEYHDKDTKVQTTKSVYVYLRLRVFMSDLHDLPILVTHCLLLLSASLKNFSLDLLDLALGKGGLDLMIFQWIRVFQINIARHVAPMHMHDETLKNCGKSKSWWVETLASSGLMTSLFLGFIASYANIS